jgi:hypothetical protein
MSKDAGVDRSPSEFPMTVKNFLSEAEFHLRRGDVILSRSPTLVSRLIRWATDSSFSHSALVFLTRNPQEGFENTFLLECDTRGVGLANLRDYIAGRSPAAEIAILRIEGPGLDEDFFKHVRGLMLNHIKSGYDYQKIWLQTLELVFGLRLASARLRLGGNKSMREAVAATRTRKKANWVPPQFICSGFIQFGLSQAARRAQIDPASVIMKDGLSPNDRHGLLATTPEDIAVSSRMTWQYVARRGYVHKVDSHEQAVRKLR